MWLHKLWKGILLIRHVKYGENKTKTKRKNNMQRNTFALPLAFPVWHTGCQSSIGHFRVPKTLPFKMRLGAQPFLWNLHENEKWFPYQRLSTNPHFQNEARCTTFLVKMSFICMRTENDFHIKGWAPTLVLKQRPGGTRKWPITNAVEQAPAGYLHPYVQKHKLCPTYVYLQCFQ